VAELGSKRAEVTPHKLTRVFLDWPDAQKESMPAQSALITSVGKSTFEPSGRGARLLPDTADLFYPDTLLRYLGQDQLVPLSLIIWSAHKDQRRGIEARLLQLLAAERHTEATGRRIMLPEYFSRTIRYALEDTERPDSAEGARGAEWILDLTILAEVPHVELVWSPGRVEGVQIDVSAGS